MAAVHRPATPPSDIYFGRIVSGPEFRFTEDMKYEVARLSSFQTWPPDSPISPLSLVQAGLFYTGHEDQVECFVCHGLILGWERGDIPSNEHRKHFPQCAFVQGTNTDNVKLEILAPITFLSRFGLTDEPQNNTSESQSLETIYHDRPEHGEANSSSATGSNSTDTDTGDDQMKNDTTRLASYVNWPRDCRISPLDLTRGGFYYLGHADRVKCAYCGVVLRNWEVGDRVDVEHRRFSPECSRLPPLALIEEVAAPPSSSHLPQTPAAVQSLPPFATFLSGSNPSNDPPPFSSDQPNDLGIMQNQPLHPNYSIEFVRLRTYHNWPVGHPKRPADLAHAGFFFSGVGDNVRCFFCDGGLRNWEETDNEWEEHARWFPDCSYVRQVKGPQYIQHIQQSFHLGQQESNARVETREVRARMDTPMVAIILDMGFDAAHVRSVIERRLASTGNDFANAQSLLQALLDGGDEDRDETAPTAEQPAPAPWDEDRDETQIPSAPTAEQPVSTHNPDMEMEPQAATEQAKTRNQKKRNKKKKSPDLLEETMECVEGRARSESPCEDQSIAEKIRELQTQKTCKICMDADVNITFLPCGHLVSCATCAPALRNCPICRGLIRGTVRTFMS